MPAKLSDDDLMRVAIAEITALRSGLRALLTFAEEQALICEHEFGRVDATIESMIADGECREIAAARALLEKVG